MQLVKALLLLPMIVCVDACVAEGKTCGGPGLEERSCCHGLTCKRHLLGTANMQCVRAEPQCIRPGQICGCVGCLTQRCCGGAECLGADKKYCIYAHMASFAEEDNVTVRAEDEALAVEENSSGLAEFLP